MVGAIAVGIGPALLIAFALWAARDEHVLGLNALLFAALATQILSSPLPPPKPA
jgi:threonine/homoserine efflux transporter RhtA